jgi:diguanylate cyclase (GGDEF)-like protein
MSLIKQLWLAIALLMLLAFGISFAVSSLTAKAYLEEQLYLKNLDNAASLALSMNQLPKDPTLVELQLSAQFDTGHYQLIRLTDPNGRVIVERTALSPNSLAPNWFKHWVNINVAPGTGTVMDGWAVYGNIQLESQTSYAYDTLWQSSLELLLIFALAALFSGLLGSWILKLITHPLGNVVEQAAAIGERRFVTTDEPKTLEFKQLVRSMNQLSTRIKSMLESETQRLESMRIQLQQDNLTGLFNRETFMSHLKVALTQEDLSHQGYVFLLRLTPLSKINQELGHQQTDQLILAIARTLKNTCSQETNCKAARLNGSDFALLIVSDQFDAKALAASLNEIISQADYQSIQSMAQLAMGLGYYQQGEGIAQVMMRVDACLARSEHELHLVSDLEPESSHSCQHYGLLAWKQGLSEALNTEQALSLGQFAVRSSDQSLLHTECPMRLTVFGEAQKAGVIFPWITRLHWQDKVDLAVLKKALAQLKQQREPLCINLSVESLQSAHFREGMLEHLLQLDVSLSGLLWLDIPERGIYQHLEAFRSFCLSIKPFACKIGLEHAGEHFARLAELNDLGLDYYKLDASFVSNIDQHRENQSFVQGVVTVAHAIGLLVIAEGVANAHERSQLISLGVDGVTGPAVE